MARGKCALVPRLDFELCLSYMYRLHFSSSGFLDRGENSSYSLMTAQEKVPGRQRNRQRKREREIEYYCALVYGYVCLPSILCPYLPSSSLPADKEEGERERKKKLSPYLQSPKSNFIYITVLGTHVYLGLHSFCQAVMFVSFNFDVLCGC